MSIVVNTLMRARIVAVVRLERYDAALPLAEALLAGGVSVIEFTLTGEGAFEAISRVRAALGRSVLLGVGSVLSAAQAADAAAAGAQFVVTPVVRPVVIELCRSRDLVVACGALTPTEVLAAHEAGAELIKIFPARAVGPAYLRDLLGPLPGLRLVPTGGIDASNARSYLEAGAVAVGIGGSLISPRAVAAGHWSSITQEARACVAAIS